MNERFIRISYTILFVIIAIISIITLGITASLVSKYNKDGYPPEHTGAYRDRIRLLLVASVWTTFFAREYTPGDRHLRGWTWGSGTGDNLDGSTGATGRRRRALWIRWSTALRVPLTHRALGRGERRLCKAHGREDSEGVVATDADGGEWSALPRHAPAPLSPSLLLSEAMLSSL